MNSNGRNVFQNGDVIYRTETTNEVFRVGDMVYLTKNFDHLKKGMVGRLVIGDSNLFGICFNSFRYGHDLMGNLVDAEKKQGWFVPADICRHLNDNKESDSPNETQDNGIKFDDLFT